MSSILVDGGKPLTGSVQISGAKNSVLKVVHAAMFSNEDVVVDNAPRIENLLSDLEIIRLMGGRAEWLSRNRLVLNGAHLNTHEIPYELGSRNRTAALLAAPLLYKFGKALVPKPGGCRIGFRPINRWLKVWDLLGVKVEENDRYYRLTVDDLRPAEINFKINTHMGTDNAILSSLFIPGRSVINNAAEEPEVDDLISFCNLIGADVSRAEPRKIVINGSNIFTAVSNAPKLFRIQNDRNEIVTFAVAALVTEGNIVIKGVDRNNILSFVNVLSKIGCGFELFGDEMRIWYTGELTPMNITTSPAPGFMTDWQPLITLLLTKANGESFIHDTVYTDRFGYIKDLNRMGARIDLHRPTEFGVEPLVSDDAYDFQKLGEAFTIAKVKGPTKFKGTRLHIPDLRAGATLVIAALCANGRSEVTGYENVERGYEDFALKLTGASASVTVV